MTTRQAALTALTHIVDTILGAQGNADHPAALLVVKAAATTPNDLMELDTDDIDQLASTLQDAAGNPVPLPIVVKKKILSLKRVYLSQPAAARNNTLWPTFDAMTYSTAMSESHGTTTPVATTTGTVTVGTPAADSSSYTPSQEFEKGNRRSVSDYKIFREKKHWNQYNRQLLITGDSQGIGNVFDATYKPTTAEEIDLFATVQRYAMSVFGHTLQESLSLTILRRYTDPKDKTLFGNAQ